MGIYARVESLGTRLLIMLTCMLLHIRARIIVCACVCSTEMSLLSMLARFTYSGQNSGFIGAVYKFLTFDTSSYIGTDTKSSHCDKILHNQMEYIASCRRKRRVSAGGRYTRKTTTNCLFECEVIIAGN